MFPSHDRGGTGTGQDAATTSKEIVPGTNGGPIIGDIFQKLTRASDQDPLTVEWNNKSQPLAYRRYHYATSSTQLSIYIEGVRDYEQGTPAFTQFYNLGNSFDDELIVGYKRTLGKFELTANANVTSYDEHRHVGYARTDSSGTLTCCFVDKHVNFGWSGTFADGGGNTLHVVNGLIIDRTTT